MEGKNKQTRNFIRETIKILCSPPERIKAIRFAKIEYTAAGHTGAERREKRIYTQNFRWEKEA